METKEYFEKVMQDFNQNPSPCRHAITKHPPQNNNLAFFVKKLARNDLKNSGYITYNGRLLKTAECQVFY